MMSTSGEPKDRSPADETTPEAADSAEDRWFLATCLDCEPVMPVPFNESGERDAWAIAHRAATGHRVLYAGSGLTS